MQKPSEKKNGKPDKNSKREAELEGFYQLMAHDNCDSKPRLHIRDSASGFVAGPFANGDIVKLKKKNGGKDSDDEKDEKNARPPIVARLGLQGDGLLYGVDASGNVGASILCAVR